MNLEKELSVMRQELRTKPLLNLTESRLYLGLSKHLFQYLEHNDPTFPRRKTKTKHSRELLDKWLKIAGVNWWEHLDTAQAGQHPVKAKLNYEQLN